MPIKIAVVEDDDVCAQKIESHIKKYASEKGDVFEVVRFRDGDEIASDYKPLFDIIFLDIQMRRLDGMRTAEIIRTMDKNVILIFITNMAQYAIKGYAVDALDFLLKPVPYFAFSQQLKRSLERLKSKESLNLLFPTENGIAKLDAAQILYIESFKHKIIVYTYDKMYSIIGTMREYEQKLASKHFFRCNNGYLVNLDYVKGVEGYTVIVGEYQLIISRPRKKAFMEALADYVGGVIRK